MRTLVVLLLFQFMSPSLFSVVTLGSLSGEHKTAVTPTHSSIIVPIFLKEQEERDHEEAPAKTFDVTPLINFSNHSFTHTAHQSIIYKGYNQKDRVSEGPSLYRLNCTFLI